MITLRRVTGEDRGLLYNVFQKFLHEMTAYYDNPLDDAGNYDYGWFDSYFEESDREALQIYRDDRLAGFAMLNRVSYFGGQPDHVMAEFTVFPHFRRQGTGREAVRQLFARYPGSWEIKYNRHNLPAGHFWTVLTGPYSPEVRLYSEDEAVLLFTV
ncbi:MAG: GNAT family N-acetyltransferase [Solobacterium sp.]|nr:GNAT family N-acetyltransferase [Solobacterium sp.]